LEEVRGLDVEKFVTTGILVNTVMKNAPIIYMDEAYIRSSHMKDNA
jgi:hypothetical protein